MVENNELCITEILDTTILPSTQSMPCMNLLSDTSIVDRKSGFSHFSLHLAVMHRHTECVKIAIEHGCDIECTDCLGRRPIHYAALNGDKDCMALLLHAGAKTNILDQDGLSPLHIIVICNGDKDCIELLLKFDAYINIVMSDGKSPLTCAVISENYEAARHLIFHGASIMHGYHIYDSLSAIESCGNIFFKAWMIRVQKFLPIQIAIHDREIDIIKYILYHTENPILQKTEIPRILEIAATEQISHTGDRLPVCDNTVRIIKDALKPWAPSRHRLFGPAFRRLVEFTFVVAKRLSSPGQLTPDDLPVLPVEIWMHIISFYNRGDFLNFYR